MVSVTCPACWVCRAIACISKGRLVIASGRWSGSANRTNKLHQLKISATLPASSRQRFRSCVVKPPQPHWFFSSSKVFSQSPRSRYSWPSVRISSSSEVTNPAYSHTSRSGPTSANAASKLQHQCLIERRDRRELETVQALDRREPRLLDTAFDHPLFPVDQFELGQAQQIARVVDAFGSALLGKLVEFA